ncbi:acyltransferase [Amylibacter kogurei]|uniref:Acyltransferase n=1 Tax=Paramylibacter kogurei TaxID=1889778 RepID=A0A2G5K6I5_9RHOB|nr:lysophospholipid acyltransferase family protein [Amylibacter kogurei]PIB25148.1 acyltransferase [Amylibacter kogurei]
MGKHQSFGREISYASSAKSRSGRAFIRTMENLTGRPKLLKKALGYDQDVANGKDFWEVMVKRYDVSLDFVGGGLDKIPSSGPVIVIANHPFGILDGLVLGHLMSQTRKDFRILAHRVFNKSEELNKIILPISFDETKEAVKQNLQTRKEAIDYLSHGGCIGIFPGGTVSTSARPMGQAMDPQWRNFTAKLVQKSGAAVVPVYFDGSNSRLFQIASHANYNLRMALLIREFKKRIRKSVPVVIGDPIEQHTLAKYRDNPTAMMEFLRKATYSLSPTPLGNYDHGFEFEDHYR